MNTPILVESAGGHPHLFMKLRWASWAPSQVKVITFKIKMGGGVHNQFRVNIVHQYSINAWHIVI